MPVLLTTLPAGTMNTCLASAAMIFFSASADMTLLPLLSNWMVTLQTEIDDVEKTAQRWLVDCVGQPPLWLASSLSHTPTGAVGERGGDLGCISEAATVTLLQKRRDNQQACSPCGMPKSSARDTGESADPVRDAVVVCNANAQLLPKAKPAMFCVSGSIALAQRGAALLCLMAGSVATCLQGLLTWRHP